MTKLTITLTAKGGELHSSFLQRIKKAIGIPKTVTYRPEKEMTTIVWCLNSEQEKGIK